MSSIQHTQCIYGIQSDPMYAWCPLFLLSSVLLAVSIVSVVSLCPLCPLCPASPTISNAYVVSGVSLVPGCVQRVHLPSGITDMAPCTSGVPSCGPSGVADMGNVRVLAAPVGVLRTWPEASSAPTEISALRWNKLRLRVAFFRLRRVRFSRSRAPACYSFGAAARV